MLGEHSHAILQFSGGKDSTALLYSARPYLDRITVVYGDTGAAYPHVKKYVEDRCRDLGATLHIVSPPLPVMEYTEKTGLPSDILPFWIEVQNVPWLRRTPEQLVQSPFLCCGAMIWAPMQQYIRDSGAKLVLRGAKSCDEHRGVSPGYVEDGVAYESPIWDWSDEDVFGYLEREGVDLPEQYDAKWGPIDSLDCWCCTAHAGEGFVASRLKFTRERYPEFWPELADRHQRVREAVTAEMQRISEDIDNGFA